MTSMEIEMFTLLAQKVEKLAVEKQKAEVDYGDIPADFRGQCPLISLNQVQVGALKVWNALFCLLFRPLDGYPDDRSSAAAP